jgi:MGT family glycosyltransferase
MNSTIESLAFGVPLVIIPQMIEQEMTGRRVQELGLGLTLDMDSLTIDRLRTAVEQVRHDAAIRTNLQEMQREIRNSGGYRCAADAIVAYTQSVK